MDDLLKWFHEDGSLRFKTESYFDNDDSVDIKVLDAVNTLLHKLPPDSDAVSLYYADMYESDGYTAMSLFCKHKY